MYKFGKASVLGTAFFLGTLVYAQVVQAKLSASLDRYSIAMGDTVRLTLSSDDNNDPGDASLNALQRDFEVLQRSSSVSTKNINGQRSQTRELFLEITPRREGSLIIPPFEVNGSRSEALAVDVGPEPKPHAADEVVTFDAELDRNEVYVQGQLLLTLRVQQAVNLESRSITELELDNAYVETLGQNSFQRTIDGRPWLVHEIRYAIFPESSGELVIPMQTFSGRLSSGRRSLFDSRPAGRLIRRESDAITINVKARPANYPNATWLPASNVSLEEQWSAPLDSLKTGDSVTRTITLSGEGLMGAQLPPFEPDQFGALRAYPDQPSINNVSGENGITGIRTDSVALVAVSDGEFEIPAVAIPWWDTESDSLKIARLPARKIVVAAPAALAPSNSATALPTTPTPSVNASGISGAGLWPIAFAVCLLGWLGTLLLWWRNRQTAPAPIAEARIASKKSILEACAKNDAAATQRELKAWLRAQGESGVLTEWTKSNRSSELHEALSKLESTLYSTDSPAEWNGVTLGKLIKALPDAQLRAPRSGDLPELYPTG